MGDDSSGKDASVLLKALDEVYQAYIQTNAGGKSKKRGIADLFKRWFSGFNPLEVQPAHHMFLDEVGRIVSDLAYALAGIKSENPELSAVYAGNALDIMLASKSGREKTTAEWYLTVAEYQCEPLLQYASTDKLRSARSVLLKRTPKRLMFPKQRELIKSIESLIQEKA